MKIKKTYQYDGTADVRGRRVEKIDVSAEVELLPNPNNPAKLEVIAQKMAGTVYFDADGGHLFESNMTQDMQLKAEAQGQTFEQRIRQVEVIKIRPDGDSADSEKSSE